MIFFLFFFVIGVGLFYDPYIQRKKEKYFVRYKPDRVRLLLVDILIFTRV